MTDEIEDHQGHRRVNQCAIVFHLLTEYVSIKSNEWGTKRDPLRVLWKGKKEACEHKEKEHVLALSVCFIPLSSAQSLLLYLLEEALHAPGQGHVSGHGLLAREHLVQSEKQQLKKTIQKKQN